MANELTILIVGASRGLGLALAEQFCNRDWHVIATARGPSCGLDALKARFPASLEEEAADIADEASVRALRQRLDRRTIDMLFVNAGIAKSITATPGTAPVQDFLDMMLVNAFSPVRLIEIFEDIVARTARSQPCPPNWAASPTMKAFGISTLRARPRLTC